MTNLFEITKSRIRRKILVYFFANQEENLYLRQLASILKEDPGNISKELARLADEGVFCAAAKGNQKYFSLNKGYPLYNELKSIIFKTLGAEGGLRDIIKDTKGVKLAFVYGSFAGKKENPGSDIDVLIVGAPDEAGLMKKIDVLEKRLGREINYNVYPEKEFKEKSRNKNSFIQNILKGPKIILKGSLDAV